MQDIHMNSPAPKRSRCFFLLAEKFVRDAPLLLKKGHSFDVKVLTVSNVLSFQLHRSPSVLVVCNGVFPLQFIMSMLDEHKLCVK